MLTQTSEIVAYRIRSLLTELTSRVAHRCPNLLSEIFQPPQENHSLDNSVLVLVECSNIHLICIEANGTLLFTSEVFKPENINQDLIRQQTVRCIRAG